MKYAIISYSKKKLRLDGTDRINLGNIIQTIAAKRILEDLGITDFLELSINAVDEWPDNDEIRLLVYGWNSFSDLTNHKALSVPFNKNIKPVFWGFNLECPYVPSEAKEYLLCNSPIGCRDEGTYNRLISNGMPAFISGCLTLLMPRRKNCPQTQKKVFFVDVSDKLFEFVPNDLIDNSISMTNMITIERMIGDNYITQEEMRYACHCAENNLYEISENARLVVTSRLHIAAPCVAMGIPVILAKENIDMRYAWLNKYIPLYSMSDWKTINWNPKPVSCEEDKDILKNILKIFLDREEVKVDVGLKGFFAPRYEVKYNEILEKGFMRFSSVIRKYKKFSICGVVLDTITVMDYFMEEYKDISLQFVYDVYENNRLFFEGHEINKMESISPISDMLYIVTSRKANAALNRLNLRDKIAYIATNVANADWESNLIR